MVAGSENDDAPSIAPPAKEALRIALAPEGGPLQDILIREAARLAGASAASAAQGAAASLFEAGGILERQGAAVRALDSTAPALRTALFPFPTPYEIYVESIAPALSEAVSTGGADDDAAKVVELLASSFAPTGDAAAASDSTLPTPIAPLPELPTLPGLPQLPDAEVASEYAELAAELAPGAQLAALRFGSRLLEDAAERVAAASAPASQRSTRQL